MWFANDFFQNGWSDDPLIKRFLWISSSIGLSSLNCCALLSIFRRIQSRLASLLSSLPLLGKCYFLHIWRIFILLRFRCRFPKNYLPSATQRTRASIMFCKCILEILPKTFPSLIHLKSFGGSINSHMSNRFWLPVIRLISIKYNYQ